MPTFLSDEWFDRAEAALSDAKIEGDAVVGYSIDKGPGWTIRVADGAVGLEREIAADAAPTMAMSAETAAEIAKGEASAQVAFMRGDLKIGGHVRALIDASPVIDQLGDVFAELRADTDWP